MKVKIIPAFVLLMAICVQGVCQTARTKDDFYMYPDPVEHAYNNTLGNTPADIQNLVSGFDIDIRNSTYNILHSLAEKPYWESGDEYQYKAYLFSLRIIVLIKKDTGVRRVLCKQYNKCIEPISLERLNKYDDGDCWEKSWAVWKTKVLDVLLRDPKLQNTLYDWVKPEIKRVYNKQNSEQKRLFSKALDHMIAYTSNYDHQKEKKYYNRCVSRDGDDYQFSNSFETGNSDFRLLETWVYRRVEDKTMTAPQIKNWLMRIKMDLNI